MKIYLASVLAAIFTTTNAASSIRGNNNNNNHRILEEGEELPLYIKAIEYDPNDRRQRNLQGNSGNSNRPDRTLNVGTADGQFYEIKNVPPGWADKIIVSGSDHVKITQSMTVSADGTIDFKGQNPEVVPGKGKGLFSRHLQDDAERTPEQERNLNDLRRQLQTADKTVLAVRAVGNGNVAYGFTPAFLSDKVFGTSGDLVNLKERYSSCSYDKLNFSPSIDRSMASDPSDGITTGIVDGVVTLKVNVDVTTNSNGNFVNALTSALNRVFGVSSPTQLANHVMYCLPPNSMSGIAYAYINSWNSVYKNEWCNYVAGQVHELGHNLGYAHANEAGTYKDQTGMMGYSYSEDNTKMCFNAAKSWQTGWYSDKSETITPSTQTGCFEEDVYGISDYASGAAQVVLVKINNPSSSTDFYVNFNRRSGINDGTKEGGNQVTVVRQGAEGGGYAESELLAKLSTGGSWTQSIDGKSMKVEVLSIGTFARVKISEDGAICGSASPTETPTPGPTANPTLPQPTSSPTTGAPTTSPTTGSPTTIPPTREPTPAPTNRPTSACARFTGGGACKRQSLCRWQKGTCILK